MISVRGGLVYIGWKITLSTKPSSRQGTPGAIYAYDTWRFVWEIMKKSRAWNDFLKNMCSKDITTFKNILDLFGETLFFYPVANTVSQTGCQIPYAFCLHIVMSHPAAPKAEGRHCVNSSIIKDRQLVKSRVLMFTSGY